LSINTEMKIFWNLNKCFTGSDNKSNKTVRISDHFCLKSKFKGPAND
jgi:hypothetical protein